MTTTPRKNVRVLVDWDNDGYLNQGVPEGTPPNLVTAAAYMGNTDPHLYDAVTEAITWLNPTVINTSNRGLVEYTATLTDENDLLKMGIERSVVLQENPTLPLQVADFVAALAPSTTHRVGFFAKAENAANGTFKVNRYGIGEDLSSIVTDTFDIDFTTDWVYYTFQFTTNAKNEGVEFVWNIDALETFGDLSISGLTVYEGSAVHGFSVGTLAAYDNISAEVLAINWKAGRGNFDDAIAYEGTAEVLLNNDSRKYSPAYTGSPIHGKIRQNVLVRIEIEESVNNWHTVWTGWTEAFETDVGRTSERKAYMKCNQGLFRLREGSLNYELEENITATQAIRKVFEEVGFRSAYSPHNTFLNFQAYLGQTTYTQDVDSIFSQLPEGNRTLELIGKEWGRKTSPEAALKQILEADHAKMWLARDGSWVLQLREDVVNTAVDYTMLFDTDVQSAEYTFGEDIINRVEVLVQPPKSTEQSGEVWRTRTPIAMPAKPFGGGTLVGATRYREMHFEFEEGRQQIVTEINGRDISEMDVQVYRVNPNDYDDPSPYLIEESEWDGQMHATVLGYESLRKKLQVRTNLPYRTWVVIGVSGKYIEGGSSEMYLVEDEDAQELINAVKMQQVELQAAGDADTALNFANYILHRKAYPVGEFRSMTVIEGSILPTIGDVIDITETQTGETNRKHIIIEETGDYSSGGGLSITYTMARLDEQPYLAEGDTLAISSIDAIPSMMDDFINSGGYYEEKTLITPEGDTVMEWYTGVSGAGLLIFGNTEDDYQGLHIPAHANDNGEIYGDFLSDPYNTPPTDSPVPVLFGVGEKQELIEPEDMFVMDDFGIENLYESGLSGDVLHNSVMYFAAKHNPLETNRWFPDTYLYFFPRILNEKILLSVGMWRWDDLAHTWGTDETDVDMEVRPTSTFTDSGNLKWSGTLHETEDLMLVRNEGVTGGSLSSAGAISFWMEDPNLNGFDRHRMYAFDGSLLYYSTLPTDRLSLDENTTYYYTVWVYSPKAIDLHIKVLAGDGDTLLYDGDVALSIGFNRKEITFTTLATSGDADKNAIILYAHDSSDPYAVIDARLGFYGMTIGTEQAPETYEEASNSDNKNLLYI